MSEGRGVRSGYGTRRKGEVDYLGEARGTKMEEKDWR